MAPRSAAKPKDVTSSPLTQEQVVGAALASIDAHGLEAFSMRNLARELGVYPTALYWHAGNRETLLAYAIGRALLEIEPPDELGAWDEWLCEFARRYRATMHRHPNLAPIVGSQMVSSAITEFHIIEVLLAKLSEGGFTGQELVDAYNVVIGAVVGFVGLELARLPDDAAWIDRMEAEIAGASPEQYPNLAANAALFTNRAFGLRWLPGTEVPLDRGFELLLTTVLGGLRAQRGG